MNMRRALLLVSLVVIGLVGLNEVSSSSATTYTRAFDRKGYFVVTQDAFLPDRTILDLELDSAEDIFIDSNDNLYIADTKNRRVIVYDPNADVIVKEITHDGFASPKGLFVTEDDILYVADSGAGFVYKFDSDGNLLDSFGKPTSASYGKDNFDPKKVAVDEQGSMYIVAEGVFDGVIQLSETGEFLGYFTTNTVQLSARQQLENLLFSDRQLEQVGDRNPVSFSNIYVDKKGIKYSTSYGLNISNLKKHNTDGSSSIDTDYGVDLELVDVYTDDYGIMYAASQTGVIYVFTSDGAFIFGFGAYESDEDVSGFYSQLSSVAVDSTGRIWTLDSDKAFLQSYTPTEYSKTIFEALALYKVGKYDEAVIKWEEVLKLNQLSVLAHNEIGRNLYSQGEYEESMEHFVLSGNRWLYSESFWEVRNVELQENLPLVIVGLFVFGVALIVFRVTNKRYHYMDKPKAFSKKITDIRIINDVLFTFAFYKQPLDSFYYMKKKQKGSYKGALILFGIMFLVYMIYVTSKGFIYQTVEPEDLDLNALIIGFFAIFGLFILANYLVTSINDGEGSMGEIFKGVSYSLSPAIIAMIAVTYLSYVLTFNELIILQMVLWVGYFGTGLLIFLAVQELHNYTIRETIKSFLLTFLFMMIVALLLAFIQIMGDQLIQFVIALFAESFLVTTGIIIVVGGIAVGLSYLGKYLKEAFGNENE